MDEPNTRKTVLFLIGNLGVGGKERQLIEMIHGLPDDRFKIFLLAKNISSPHYGKIEKKLNGLLTLDRLTFKMRDPLVVRKYINTVKPDLVLSWSDLLSHFCLVVKPCTRPYTLVNFSIRNAPMKLSMRKRFERVMYSFYPYVVANSFAGLRAYGQEGRAGRFVLYNGFDITRIPLTSQKQARELSGIEVKGRKVVTMVASLTNKKDHDTLLEAAKICAGREKKILFLLVGDGPRRQVLEDTVVKLQLEDTVHFLGRRHDVETVMKASDLSVLVSTGHFGEGISNSLIESLACAIPTIATDSPGTREVIQSGVNGEIVAPQDPEALAAKIIELLDDREKSAILAEEGRTSILSLFSMENCLENFQDILGEISRLEKREQLAGRS